MTRALQIAALLFALLAQASHARAHDGQDVSCEPEEQAPQANVQVDVHAGFGFGTRGFERPTPTGLQRLDTLAFPALDAGLRVLIWPAKRYSLEASLLYQTSIGLIAEEQPLFALPNDVGVRVSRTELSIAPVWSLWPNAGSPRIALPLGVTARSFWPETHVLQTPGFTLLGPHLRAELIAPFGPFTLRIGPEVQWIVAIDRELRRDGIRGSGVGVGAAASFAWQLHDHFGLELSYRETHALAEGHDLQPDFMDAERFATLRLIGRF